MSETNIDLLHSASNKLHEYFDAIFAEFERDDDGNVCIDERTGQLHKVQEALMRLTIMESYYLLKQYDLPEEDMEEIRSFFHE